jgi:type IV pilus assembly protein PilB
MALKERLIEILINNKLITEEELKRALQLQKEKGGSLSSILAELNLVKESDLAAALSQGLGLPLLDLKRFKIEPAIVKMVPQELARRYQILPLSLIGDTLTIAMADPLNVFAIDDIKAFTGYKINPIISCASDILELLEYVYTHQTKDMLEDIVKEISSSIELIQEEKEEAISSEELVRSSHQRTVIKVTEAILENAVKKKASDVLLEPQENRLRLRMRVDGVLQEQEPLPKTVYAPIVSRIKVISNLNIAEHRLPQESRFKARISGRGIDFRVSILPSTWGEKVALRILDKSGAMLDIDKLGFDEFAISSLKKAASRPHGMILVTGPTGSGKTTTLYSVLKFVDTPEKNIVTVEDPVEYQLEGINQVTIRPDINLTFASSLRSILRQDPDVIMIGEIRDRQTVDIAIKAALTGHLVVSSLHTTTSSGAIVRLVDMGVQPYLVVASLICVMAQRLIRKLCPECKQRYTLTKDLVKRLGLKSDSTVQSSFFKARGCKKCLNAGYRGRMGIAEILNLTPAIRDLVLNRAQESLIKQKAREEGMRTLRENAFSLAASGFTSLEEVLRLTPADE